jgi:hypothetical protein
MSSENTDDSLSSETGTTRHPEANLIQAAQDGLRQQKGMLTGQHGSTNNKRKLRRKHEEVSLWGTHCPRQCVRPDRRNAGANRIWV